MRLGLIALLCAGCGLTLDLEPDDEPRSDAATPKDQGAHDLGRGERDSGGDPDDASVDPTDAGTTLDGPGPADAMVVDARTADAGGPDMNVSMGCRQDTECDPLEYCRRPTGRCLAEGECVLRTDRSACPGMLVDPVCGCDGRTYDNSCLAAATGVTVADGDQCPDFGDARDWCAMMPPPQTVTGCIPCFDDQDCIDRTTTAFECVGSTCSPDGVGRCAFNLPAGRCYYDRHCDPGETCDGEVLRACNDPTGVAVTQGTCRD